MRFDDDVALMSQIPFFKGFAPEHLKLLSFSANALRLRDGDVLYEAETPTDSAFVLRRGTLGLIKKDEREPHTVVEQGDLLGGRALLSLAKRPSRAIAQGDVEVLELKREDFMRMLGEYPDLVAMLQERLSRNLRQLNTDMGPVSDLLRAER